MSSGTSSWTATTRCYLWSNDQVWRISGQLMLDLVQGKACLPQYANTTQRIIELSVEVRSRGALIRAIKGTAFAFDPHGYFDLGDQADALDAVLNKPAVDGNVLDIQATIRGRRWISQHKWHPPTRVIKILQADLHAELSQNAPNRLPLLTAQD